MQNGKKKYGRERERGNEKERLIKNMHNKSKERRNKIQGEEKDIEENGKNTGKNSERGKKKKKGEKSTRQREWSKRVFDRKCFAKEYLCMFI